MIFSHEVNPCYSRSSLQLRIDIELNFSSEDPTLLKPSQVLQQSKQLSLHPCKAGDKSGQAQWQWAYHRPSDMGITSATVIPRQAPFGLKDQWWYRSSLLFPLRHTPLPHLSFFLILFTQKKTSVMNRNISPYFQCFRLRNVYADITVTHVPSLPPSPFGLPATPI